MKTSVSYNKFMLATDTVIFKTNQGTSEKIVITVYCYTASEIFSSYKVEKRLHVKRLQNFHSLFTVRRYASTVYACCLSVRPSVRLSVTSRCPTKKAKPRITQTTPYDSLGNLVFIVAKDLGEILRGSPPTGELNRGGVG